jgi:hypothetical protein
MENPLDVELKDHVLDDEIRLVTELMVVATMAPGELEQQVIDETLGVQPGHMPLQRDAEWDL